MRFLYFTDTHSRISTPVTRKDHYAQSVQRKLREIADLARVWEVDAFLHGGDFWDYPNPSFREAALFLAPLQQVQIPIFIIAGNHDLCDQDLDTLPHTMLGWQGMLGQLHLIRAGERRFFRDKNICVQLTGQPFHQKIDQRDPKLDYCVRKGACDYAIHLAHGMVMAEEAFPGSGHTPIKDIRDTEADLTLLSHMHFGFPDQEFQGKTFINIGAMVRLTNHLSEFHRQIQVLLIDCGHYPVRLQKIHLKSVLPVDHVLDRDKAEEIAHQVLALSNSIYQTYQTGGFTDQALTQIIETLGLRPDLRREIYLEALRNIYFRTR